MVTIRGYTVEAEIGRGGMSVVYEAVHDMLKTRHAVKALDVPPDSENGKPGARQAGLLPAHPRRQLA